MQCDGIGFGNSTHSSFLPHWPHSFLDGTLASEQCGTTNCRVADKAVTPSSPISIRFLTSKVAQEWAYAEQSCPSQNWGVGAEVQGWRTEGRSPGQGCNTWCHSQDLPSLARHRGVVDMDKVMTPSERLIQIRGCLRPSPQILACSGQPWATATVQWCQWCQWCQGKSPWVGGKQGSTCHSSPANIEALCSDKPGTCCCL